MKNRLRNLKVIHSAIIPYADDGFYALEKEERLEQLRAIQNSLKINLIIIDDKIISIDTLDDVERLMKAQKGQD